VIQGVVCVGCYGSRMAQRGKGARDIVLSEFQNLSESQRFSAQGERAGALTLPFWADVLCLLVV